MNKLNLLSEYEKQQVLSRILHEKIIPVAPETSEDPDGGGVVDTTIAPRDWYNRHDIDMWFVLKALGAVFVTYLVVSGVRNYRKFTRQYIKDYGKKPHRLLALSKSGFVYDVILNFLASHIGSIKTVFDDELAQQVKAYKEMQKGVNSTNPAVRRASQEFADELQQNIAALNKNYKKLVKEMKTAIREGYTKGKISLDDALEKLGYISGVPDYNIASARLQILKKIKDGLYKTNSTLKVNDLSKYQSYIRNYPKYINKFTEGEGLNDRIALKQYLSGVDNQVGREVFERVTTKMHEKYAANIERCGITPYAQIKDHYELSGGVYPSYNFWKYIQAGLGNDTSYKTYVLQKQMLKKNAAIAAAKP